jgi:uncharacterized protein (UPF0333 family)
MEQKDLIINNVSVVLNTDENNWTNNNLIILKNDISQEEIISIVDYLYEEGFILDRRIEYKIV